MVLYHADGRVVKTHEESLEREEARLARAGVYRNQIVVARTKDPNAREEEGIRVRIVVDTQEYGELYHSASRRYEVEDLGMNVTQNSRPIPEEGLDRRTLMRLSSFADDFFTYSSDAAELHLPVRYPQINMADQYDRQLAYIRLQEIEQYIVPWLHEMEGMVEVLLHKMPQIEVPEDLLGKIHLYNAMLQLGIAKRFQQRLIDALVLQMYKTNLKHCHLDTLEMTVGRFYSRGIPVLDPVLGHFIGTYSLRSVADRQNAEIEDDLKMVNPDPPVDDHRGLIRRYLPEGTKRGWLHYKFVTPDLRAKFPDDTVSVPARLEVLANNFRHWSGVRRNGSTAPAHLGLPLNIGRVLKYYRRRPTDRIYLKPKPETKKAKNDKLDPKNKSNSTEETDSADDIASTDKDDAAAENGSATEDEDAYDSWDKDTWGRNYAEYDTHRLMRRQYFRRNAPGVTIPPTQPPQPPGPGPRGPA